MQGPAPDRTTYCSCSKWALRGISVADRVEMRNSHYNTRVTCARDLIFASLKEEVMIATLSWVIKRQTHRSPCGKYHCNLVAPHCPSYEKSSPFSSMFSFTRKSRVVFHLSSLLIWSYWNSLSANFSWSPSSTASTRSDSS